MSAGVAGLVVTERDGAVRFAVRVMPRSPRSCVDGVHAGALRVRVHAPPVEGAANAAAIEVIAAALGVPRRDVRIAQGQTSRTKLVEVSNLGPAAVYARLRR